MPTIPATFAQINLQFVGSAAPNGSEITFGVNNSTGLTATQVGVAATNAWDTNLKSKTNSDLTLSVVRAKLGPNASGPFSDVAVGVAGTQVSTPVSPQVAMLVNKLSVLGGRKHRGKWYWPGLPEAHVDSSGQIGSVDLSAYNAAFTAFLAALGTANIPMVILHHGTDTPTDVSSLQVSPKVATQRDRLRRR